MTELNVRRKTTREALSGVDIFESAYRYLVEEHGFRPTQIDCRFREFLYKRPFIELTRPNVRSSVGIPSATFQFRNGIENYVLNFYEGENEPDSTYNFQESEITDFCKLANEEIIFEGPMQHSAVQIFATMSKTLFRHSNLGDAEGLTLVRVQMQNFIPLIHDEILKCKVQFKFRSMRDFNVSTISNADKIIGILTWSCLES